MQHIESVLHNPIPFSAGGQTFTDRINAAKHSLAGSQLGKTVCKATTEEMMGPKKKHLDYLLHCTHEANVSIPQLANLLIERAHSEQWSVSFKSLITIHNLMCYGNERFSQYLASCSARLDMDDFMDKSTTMGYDMSVHVRSYANYITAKIKSYRVMAFDFCKVKRGKEDGLLRTMATDNLHKTLPVATEQIDALLQFSVDRHQLNNGVINSAFILLFRDLIRLFAVYNDGIINMLEKYFDMNKKQARESLTMYKSFIVRMDKVSSFLKIAEAVGIDKDEIPDLARAPHSLLDALEAHLAQLEGRPVGSTISPAATAERGIHQLESGVDSTQMDASTKQKYLEEEKRVLDKLKSNQPQQQQGQGQGAVSLQMPNNTKQTSISQNSAEFFDVFGDVATSNALNSSSKPPSRPPAPGGPPARPSTNVDSLFSANADPFDTAAQQAQPTQPVFNPFADAAPAPQPSYNALALQSLYTNSQQAQQAPQSNANSQYQYPLYQQTPHMQMMSAPFNQQYSTNGMPQSQAFPPAAFPQQQPAQAQMGGYQANVPPSNAFQPNFGQAFGAPSVTLTTAKSPLNGHNNNNTANGLYTNGQAHTRQHNNAFAAPAHDVSNPFASVAAAPASKSNGSNPFADTGPAQSAAFNPFATTTTATADNSNPFASFTETTAPSNNAFNPFGNGSATPAKPAPPKPPPPPPGRPAPPPARPPPSQAPKRPPPAASPALAGMDKSYTASPQLDRHMMAQAQQDAGLDPLGDLLTPSGSGPNGSKPASPLDGQKTPLTGDLDSSLASLMTNLDMKGKPVNAAHGKPVQWSNQTAPVSSTNPFK